MFGAFYFGQPYFGQGFAIAATPTSLPQSISLSLNSDERALSLNSDAQTLTLDGDSNTIVIENEVI